MCMIPGEGHNPAELLMASTFLEALATTLDSLLNSSWTGMSGLFLDFLGALILSYGLIIKKEDAIKLGVDRYCGETEEENLKLPKVQDRLKQSKSAKIGLVFLTFGFILQVIGGWPKS